MMPIDPISMVYGMVIGTVLTALIILGAMFWEDMTRRDDND